VKRDFKLLKTEFGIGDKKYMALSFKFVGFWHENKWQWMGNINKIYPHVMYLFNLSLTGMLSFLCAYHPLHCGSNNGF
jgi:hypothetical protein